LPSPSVVIAQNSPMMPTRGLGRVRSTFTAPIVRRTLRSAAAIDVFCSNACEMICLLVSIARSAAPGSTS
jgi:hypothetical protein